MSTKEAAVQSPLTQTRKVAAIGMFAAIAAVLMFFEFPLPVAPVFYKLDFSEVPVLIGTFCYGPLAGVLIELVKILVKTVIKGTSTAFVGEIANFAIGCAMIIPAGIIYMLKKTRKRAIIGLVAGTLVMTLVGAFLNAYVLLPAYSVAYGMPIDSLVAMGAAINASVTDVLSFAMLLVVPFNLIKGLVVSILTCLLYKHISRLIKGAND